MKNEEMLLIKMSKEDAIKFYANKIIEEGIGNCSEFNYCVPLDFFDDNGFVRKNQEEILNRINKDERVSHVFIDKQSEEHSFDMVFPTDYCPYYYEDAELAPRDEAKYLRKFIDKLIQINNNAAPQYFTTVREVMRSFIDDPNLSRYPVSEDERDDIYNKIKEYIANTKFQDKYVDIYEVTINKENIKELIVELQEAGKKIDIYKKDGVTILKKIQLDEMLKIYEEKKIFPNKYIGLFMYEAEEKFLAIDNYGGEMFIEEFDTKEKCLDYLFGDPEEEEEEEQCQ